MPAYTLQRITLEKPEKFWTFPQDKYVTYEKSDEPWCRFFGIGREAIRLVKVSGMGVVKQVRRDVVEGNEVKNIVQLEFIHGSDYEIDT